ncbi:MAG: hypothetical protein UR12_C0025G0006 [candidate division TM6 bacterium GW2011_GWF2_30_66]|jgi:hypothetical protein|nr:MAG: hypothetical protein UR12_C0025G0006 [candidate division TM6 bacterium GW2011_GWF2_30_66]
MLENKEIITIVFKLINFAAFIWLVKYVFKSNILPDLKEKLSAKFALFKRLEEKNKDLIFQNELLEKEIKDQDKLFELLKEKINTWDKELKKEKEINILEYKKIIASHKNRTEIQAQNMHNQKLISEIFPRVIAGTFKQLEQKFKQEQESEKFFRNIINYMQNNTTNGAKDFGITK